MTMNRLATLGARSIRVAMGAPGAVAAFLLVVLFLLIAAGNARATGPCERGRCDSAQAVVIDSIGRIVVAGGCQEPPGEGEDHHAFWRLNDDGTPDLTFGNGGVVLGAAAGGAGEAVIGSDGTLFVRRVSGGEIVVMRYGPDGSAIESVPEGGDSASEAAQVRLSSNGLSAVIDSTGGIVVIDNGPHGEGSPGPRPRLLRFNADGTEDIAFATSASTDQGASVPVSTLSAGADITVDGDGRIVVVGNQNLDDSAARLALWRFSPDGAPDTSFGDGGMVRWENAEPEVDDIAAAVAMDNAGRVLVAGTTYVPVAPDPDTGARFAGVLAIWCFTSDGQPDQRFGEGGRAVRSHDSPTATVQAIQIDAESRIVVLGWGMNQGSVVLRYLPDGTPDDEFGEAGLFWQREHLPDVSWLANAMDTDSLGRIVLAGFTQRYEFDAVVWRLNPDGSLDRSFGTDGVTTYDRLAGFGGAQ